MTKLFRWIIVISTFLFIVYWAIPYHNFLKLSEIELSLLRADGYGSLIPNSPLIYWGLFSAWFAIMIGLFFYINLARIAYAALIIIVTIVSFFWGFRVMSPFDYGMSSILTFSDGVLLTMAYLTSVSHQFKKTPNPSLKRDRATAASLKKVK